MEFKDVASVTLDQWAGVLKEGPPIDRGLVVGGPPCQSFSGLNAKRKGFGDPRSDGIGSFVKVVQSLTEASRLCKYTIQWDFMLENVSSMLPGDRAGITSRLEALVPHPRPLWFDAALLGPVSRPRLYWCSWEMVEGEFKRESRADYDLVSRRERSPIHEL